MRSPLETRQRAAKSEKAARRRPLRNSQSRRLFGGRQGRRLGRSRGRFGGCLLLALGKNELVALERDFAQLVHHRAGAGRDQTADDDVLLETVERVGLAADRSFGEYTCCLLERSGRDERTRLQGRLGDAEQHRVPDRRLLAFGHRPSIDLVHFDLVDLFALDQVGLAGVFDLHLLQHLANDHLDVLVVDADALQPVDLLDLVDEVAGQLLDAFDRQNVVRRRVAFDDEVALFDDVAVLQVDVLALGNEIFPRLLALVGRLDGDAPLVLVVAAETDRAGGLGDDRRFLRTPGLEQLGNARQTAGDVAGLGAFRRDAGDDVARLHLGGGIGRDDGVDRQHVAGVAAAGELEDLAVLALDHQRRAQVLLAAGGARAPIDHHALGDAGRLVERFGHRLTFDQILEADRALHFGHDRPRIRIPLGDALAALDVVAGIDLESRAVRNAVYGSFGTVRIDHGHDQVAAHRDQVAVRISRHVQVLDLDRAFEIRLDERLLGDLRCAADVERPHGELRTRLPDRLGGDNAHRLAHIDRRAAREIAPVALAANARLGVAGEHRTDADLLDAGGDDLVDVLLAQDRTVRHKHFVTRRIAHVLSRGAAENAARQRRHHGAGVDDRPHLDAAGRAAILFGDDAVLRHVDETPGQVTGV